MRFDTVKIIFTDVDGVLTNGDLLVLNNGLYGKIFNTRDGLGIEKAIAYGIKIYWITGRSDYATKIRAEELGCKYVFTNGRTKEDLIKNILDEAKLKKDNAIFVGDDITDVRAKSVVKYFLVPQDGHKKARESADLIINKNGGKGVLREVIDLILNEE